MSRAWEIDRLETERDKLLAEILGLHADLVFERGRSDRRRALIEDLANVLDKCVAYDGGLYDLGLKAAVSESDREDKFNLAEELHQQAGAVLLQKAEQER